MFCKNCGKEIADNTKFCNHCGASQEDATNQPVTTAPVATAKRKNNTLIIAIIAAVAVIAVVLVVVFALPKKDNTPTGNSAPTTSDSSTDDSSASAPATDTQSVPALDGGYNTGMAFVSDMGEYGKVSLGVGYNSENGVVRQVTASFTITNKHSEFASMKADFDSYESRISALNDSRVQCAYTDLADSISCIVSFQELYTADRAQRVALATEILDFIPNQNDCAFYINDLKTLLTETYGFVVQE